VIAGRGDGHRSPAHHGFAADTLTLCLGGDVMTGRGIDQILPSPGEPEIHEPHVRDARDYVTLAEHRSGAIARPVDFAYPWGDLPALLARLQPDLRIVNLETSITTSERYDACKGIHYRMHPGNAPSLSAAALDCCVLANNHVLDWGTDGLLETLAVLDEMGLARAGAGRTLAEAAAPAVLDSASGRVLVYACGLPSSGIPEAWAASTGRPGVLYLDAPDSPAADALLDTMAATRQPGDRIVLSVHWGGNWGYAIPDTHRRFAHRAIDHGAADVVHGHSSHHPLAIEVYRDRPILYGCGDLLNDYEGIRGYEAYRADLTLLYLPALDARGALSRLRLLPLRIRRLRLERCPEQDAVWLAERLGEQSRRFGLVARLDGAGEVIEVTG
jgi:poly-gamma-glutamate synthesis protein (capsule biosynthesis protein)